MKRLRLSLALLLLLLPPVWAAEPLPAAADFQADARQSREEGVPILVFFAADGCPYCELVEDLYLGPMHSGGDYRQKVLFRVVRIDSAARLRDFSGESLSHADFAARHKVQFTPVIKFFGPDGRELAPALVGVTTPDFYYGELEAAIDRAVTAYRQRAQALPGSNAPSS